MPDDKSEKSCWIITEGIAGTENQCIGIAEALGIDPRIIRISLREPWKSLSPYIGFECAGSFSPALHAPWPDLLIASGRKSIAAARYIQRKSLGKTLVVFVQDPRITAKNFDLIAVPEHDPLRGDNVLVTQGSPNKITIDKINKAKEDFPHLGHLSSPRVAVLIGGSSKAYTMSEDITRKLVQDLQGIDASLMVTCSRRTGEQNKKIIETALTSETNYIWDGQGENPYMGFLGWADFILVTADSASMISESCTTGKPVYMIPLDGGAKRISALHNNLIKAGALRVFDGYLEEYAYEPLNDAKKVAQEINKRFGGFTLRD